MSTESKIKFIQYHQPGLLPGTYRILLSYQIDTEADSAASKVFPDVERSFEVAAERFSLKPSDIRAVFPPDGNLGDHSNVLPHVVLNRSALPWERRAEQSDPDFSERPWLAVLLFDHNEAPVPNVMKVSALKSGSARFPDLKAQPGQNDDDSVTVIEVRKTLLQAILPSLEDLRYLAHVRQADNGTELAELAVVIGNRLPGRGSSIAHLVSLEARYDKDGFNYLGADDTGLIRLVSLANWHFSCTEEKQTFKESLAALVSTPGTRNNNHTLRLPARDNAIVEKYAAMGFVPLRHKLRQGDTTLSWYHGPFLPGRKEPEATLLPIRAADQLFRFDPSTAFLDVSYAAAWELGRLLALQSQQLSAGLYNWKRDHAQQLKGAEQSLLHSHLPGQRPTSQISYDMPEDIVSWFSDLSLMKAVPFNYIVPGEDMLPNESIRFFWVDNLWVECLLDGAFSIGRISEADRMRDASQKETLSTDGLDVTGLLLSSHVVAGWPGLLVDAYNGNRRLDNLRVERISPNILLCLFDGEPTRVEIHQKPEMLHFGLDIASSVYEKVLRDQDGNEQEALTLKEIPVRSDTRVVDVARLAQDIKNIAAPNASDAFTSADFALQMIEGVDKVTFSRGEPQ